MSGIPFSALLLAVILELSRLCLIRGAQLRRGHPISSLQSVDGHSRSAGWYGGFHNASVNSSGAILDAKNSAAARMAFRAAHMMQANLTATPFENAEAQCEILRDCSSSPTLCAEHNDRVPMQKLQKYLLEFKAVWAERQKVFPNSLCCMGINHQFAIFVSLKELQPSVVIESGVAMGHLTWLLRHTVGPDVPIFSIDIGDPAIMYGAQAWKDTNPKTTYLVGAAFVDLSMARWDVVIPDEKVRERAFVILDDHQSSVERLQMLRRWGFRHAFYEDNYPFRVSTSQDTYTCERLPTLQRTFPKLLFGDAYSPNTVCAPVPPGTTSVLHKDHFGHKCKFLTLGEHAQNVEWYKQNVQNYFEFPAVFSECSGLTRTPILGNNRTALSEYGFPAPLEELWYYGHLYPALIDLKPLNDTFGNSKDSAGRWHITTERREGQQQNIKDTVERMKELRLGLWP